MTAAPKLDPEFAALLNGAAAPAPSSTGLEPQFASLMPTTQSAPAPSNSLMDTVASSGLPSIHMAMGLAHGLGTDWNRLLNLAGGAAKYSGFDALMHHLEPQGVQSAMGKAQQALTFDPSAFPVMGASGKAANFVGQIAPTLPVGEGLGGAVEDALSGAPQALGTLGRALSSNGIIGALLAPHHPGVGAALGALTGGALEGAGAGAGKLAESVRPPIQRFLDWLPQAFKTPTQTDAEAWASRYAREAVTPADIAKVGAFTESVPGVVHAPATITNSPAMLRQMAAAGTRGTALEEGARANSAAILNHLSTIWGSGEVGAGGSDTSNQLLESLRNAKQTLHAQSTADREPLEAIKGQVHVDLPALQSAYRNATAKLGKADFAQIPTDIRDAFTPAENSPKTMSYQDAESYLRRIKSAIRENPADGVRAAVLNPIRNKIAEALYASKNFYTPEGAPLPPDYGKFVSGAQDLANTSWQRYRTLFPKSQGTLTPAGRFIADAANGKMNAGDFARKLFSAPEYLDAYRQALSTPAKGTDLVAQSAAGGIAQPQQLAMQALRDRMSLYDKPLQNSTEGDAFLRSHYLNSLKNGSVFSTGKNAGEDVFLNGNKLRALRGDTGKSWVEDRLLSPQDRLALDQAQEASIRNAKRFTPIGRGSSPTEFLRQANKAANVHPGAKIAAAMTGAHGIPVAAALHGADLLSQRYATALDPLYQSAVERMISDPDYFLRVLKENPEIGARASKSGALGLLRTLPRAAGHAGAAAISLNGVGH